MEYRVTTMAFLFFIYSICGWLIESVYRSVNAQRFVNPGFLRGPWVPLYGTGAILILLVCELTREYSLTMRMAAYFVSISLLELVVGETMLRLFGRRWWDYRDERFNIRGHVCPGFSLYWVVLALIFENTVYPGTMLMMGSADPVAMTRFTLVFAVLMAADALYSSGIAGSILEMMRDSRAFIRQGGPARDLARVFACVQAQLPGGYTLRGLDPALFDYGRAARTLGIIGGRLRKKFRSTLRRANAMRSGFARRERP
jgi:uncharacterized membrane protein